MHRLSSWSFLLAIGALAIVSASAVAEDWPQWRGIDRDGVIHDSGLIDSLPDGELPKRWTAAVGPGYSGPTVAEGRVYLTDRGTGGEAAAMERVLCFDAQSGQRLWKHEYHAPYTIQYRAGPRAAVTVHDGAAYAVGAMGHFHCLDAVTGDVRWSANLAERYDARMPNWGIAAAPLVYRDLVIQVAAGSGDSCVVALDRANGRERWRALDERAGYSAPILIRQGEQDVVVCWTGESISGLDPLSGKTFWSIPMQPRNMPIGVPTPVVDDNRLLVSSFYDGSMLIRLDSERPAAEKVWHRVGLDEKNTDALHCMIGTPIIKGDYIYGVDSYGELRCLELATGDRVWENVTAVPRARWATVHIMRYGDREIMLNDQGELIFARLTPEGYHEQSRAKLIDRTQKQLRRRGGVVWAHPAVAAGHIFARNDEELVCASLRPE
jgi:outer membrane protein assembly factor BamB